MRNCRAWISWAGPTLAGLGASAAGGEPPAADHAATLRAILTQHTNYIRILDNNPIYLPVTGRVDAAFDMVREIAPDVELVARLARAAVDSSFRLRRDPNATNAFTFTNVNKEDCDLLALQNSAAADTFSSTTVAEGERFFGRFIAIIRLESERAPDGKAAFVVHLYAYPENAVWRFIARNVRTVSEYFRDRVMAIMGISARAYEAMQHEPGKILDAMERNRNPTNDLSFTQAEMDHVRSLLERFAGRSPGATNARGWDKPPPPPDAGRDKAGIAPGVWRD
ncbi:MAG: hypothetical protein QME60_07790 [Verrucomicrobiota bacterium]|nr:hypothetical protein [Verrucomicrobiota bacterium]